jgi:hypothetical protein
MANKKPRAGRLTLFERKWISILKNSDELDVTRPFAASQAERVLLGYRNPDNNMALRYPPNKFRLNYVFKKSDCFQRHQDSYGNNTWTIAEACE